MDEDISIINQRTQNEKIKNFFINNKKIIIILISIIIIGLIVFFGFGEYKNIKKKQISDNYNSIIINFSNENSDLAKEKLIEIVKEKDSTYSPLALYFIIDNNLDKNQDEINELFDILIDKTSLENEVKNLNIYKKALYNADNIDENNLLKILSPLINSDSVWKSHALYLVAEFFYFKGEKQKSKEFFNKILILENSDKELKLKAQRILNRDLSD
jgi:predicted negative regulator of RcsB-dependent stress response|tara:strand:- start:1244 stop:1888 length:645 start_codon:yes stop_codon:yes gene_type:complete